MIMRRVIRNKITCLCKTEILKQKTDNSTYHAIANHMTMDDYTNAEGISHLCKTTVFLQRLFSLFITAIEKNYKNRIFKPKMLL